MNSFGAKPDRHSESLVEIPVRVPLRGRGAVSQPAGRFERLDRSGVDDGWYREDGEAPPLRTEVSDEHARHIISWNRSPDVPFDRAINPYRGCEHGCTYCFARPTHAWLGLSPGLDFETRLRAKVNAAERLRAELSAPGYRCAPINIGAATDAYQPVERERRITRQILEVLAGCSHPLTIVTKSSLIERDLDLLAPMAGKRLAAVYVTITTLDARLARSWEPRAAAPWRRLRTIRRLADAGIPVGVSVAPVAPFLNEPELETILEQAAQAGAVAAFYTVLRLPWELREVFGDWLASAYPDRARRVMNRLREMRGASPDEKRVNDPRFFSRMTGQGAWAELLRLRFQLAVRRLGLDRGRVELRSDLFVPPARESSIDATPAHSAPVRTRGAGEAAGRTGARATSVRDERDDASVQGELFRAL